MSRRYKGAVSDRDVDRYFPVRISIVIGMGLPAREWGVTFSAMLDWLKETAGHGRHVVLPQTAPGQPDAMRVLFASFDDARAFVDRFEIPIAPIGEHPKR
jgi:hypothetical protein